ncbi:ATP-binding protein [Peribacillus alkalitolerans]|uniref:ATP-binding protein n=1 Tax=Peribacillus alkalitolerans TaxID=1550385 RepID=UPI0013D076AD|nr:ATP-binding protein [Peribacillus alkalitolerans]
MKIVFKTLTLQNFKSHRDLTVNFGEETKITADNAQGKSTISEAFTWLLYSTDVLGGSKFDPTPITYEADETMVTLLFTFDGKQKLLGKGLKKGKAQYYVDEVPKKAGEFNELVTQLFGDKDLFLSLYNPNYFFTMHPDKQRELIMQYVSAPANKEVLKHMLDEQKKCIEPLLKKNSLEDIKEIHRERKISLDKKYIQAQTRTKTLKEQLDRIEIPNAPIDSLKAELSQIDREVREIEAEMDSAGVKNKEYHSVHVKLRSIQDQIEMSKERWPSLKNEMIEDTCRTCKRPLDDESVEAVKLDKEARIEEYKTKHSLLIKQRDELKSQLAAMDFIDVSELREKLRIDEKGTPLRNAIRDYFEYQNRLKDVEEAQMIEKETLTSLNDSIFILDTIKAFKAKEAELQAEKVKSMFDTLSFQLFELQKNGEVKTKFEIEMNGTPYRKLSLSEGIRAGLELSEVLSKQSELNVPVFVDNAESITSFKAPTGQLIISRVVAGQALKIEG